jgi:hypothetical protein
MPSAEGEFKRMPHLLWCTEAATPPQGEVVPRQKLDGGFGESGDRSFPMRHIKQS